MIGELYVTFCKKMFTYFRTCLKRISPVGE